MRRVSVVVSMGVLAVAACAPRATDTAPSAEARASAAKAGSVLEVVNDATFEVLDQKVGLDPRAAQNIVDHVNGPDGVRGTADDDSIDTMDELDAIPYVGPTALARLAAWAQSQGTSGSWITVEGVPLAQDEAAWMMSICNTATFEQLDVDAALDSRAAHSIVDGRPAGSLQNVAKLPYVGAAAITALKAYVPTWDDAARFDPPAGEEQLSADAKAAWNGTVTADGDTTLATYAVTRAALPAGAATVFDDYTHRFPPGPQAYSFPVDGETVFAVGEGGEEIYWLDLFDAAGNRIAHGYDGDSGPSIGYWNPAPWDPSIQ